MRRPIRLVLLAGLAGWATYALISRARYEAELRRLLAGLDGSAPPLTYQDLMATDGDPVSEEKFRFLTRRRGPEEI